jgi:acyl-CoA thioester hydrolase
MKPDLQRSDFRLLHRLRVRWAEVDPQGIVFNGNYLTYADIGITEYFRALGIGFPLEMAEDGSEFFAVRTLLDYLAPARFDEEIQVGIRVSRMGRSSMTFSMGIWRADTALTAGEIVYVLADTHSRSSRPLPDWLREKVRKYEVCPVAE